MALGCVEGAPSHACCNFKSTARMVTPHTSRNHTKYNQLNQVCIQTAPGSANIHMCPHTHTERILLPVQLCLCEQEVELLLLPLGLPSLLLASSSLNCGTCCCTRTADSLTTWCMGWVGATRGDDVMTSQTRNDNHWPEPYQHRWKFEHGGGGGGSCKEQPHTPKHPQRTNRP